MNLQKCKFFENKVKYLGHEISYDGIKPNKEKVTAIIEASIPQNLTQLKGYLGMLNYYGKFLPKLSDTLFPLYQLTKKNICFEWSIECDRAYKASKELLTQNQLLIHYDPNKSIIIRSDASPYGLGAVLSHEIDGRDRPVLFSSSTLTSAQKNYPQLHREALAIIFAVQKFHKYIYGKSFKIYSDHQPLRDIFNDSKITPIAAGRLQR